MKQDGTILRAEGLTKVYDQGRIRALDRVDLAIGRGEFVSIIGPSGSGKSTLLHLLGALDRPDGGRVILDGVDLALERRLDRVRARSIGFVFQLHNLVPSLTARENVELPLRALRVGRRERVERASRLLAAVELADRADHLPTQLSGGQRQRVAIARALVNEPALVLADEPTGDLDQASGGNIMELLLGLRRERGLTLVLVTHDTGLAERADRTIRLLDGRVAAG
ncbi:MAG: ABC transporter ATP-binding protein [Planctomycetota bacterium]|nr:ABC transporter ATP-binding protein [Planctomycetota bacterium]